MNSQHNENSTLNQSTCRQRLNRSLTSRLSSRLRASQRQFSSNILGEGTEKDRRTFDRPKADYTTIKGMLQERMLLEIGEQYLYGSSSQRSFSCHLRIYNTDPHSGAHTS